MCVYACVYMHVYTCACIRRTQVPTYTRERFDLGRIYRVATPTESNWCPCLLFLPRVNRFMCLRWSGCSWEYRGSSHFSCKVLRRMKFPPCRRIGNFVAKDSLRRTQKYIPVRWDTFLYHCVSFYSLIFLLVDSITDKYLLWTINFFLLFIVLSFIHVVARSTIATYCFI